MTHILQALTGGTRLHAALAIGLALVLSGCIGGGGDASDDEDTGDGSGGNAVTTTTTSEDFNNGVIVDAKRHFHHYWDPDGEGGAPPLEKVSIFHDERELKQDAFTGGEFGCRSIGHDEFDLESDEDDVGPGAQTPINPSPTSGTEPRADTVFAGTNMIEILLTSVPDNAVFENDMAQIYIRYKPANLNFYVPDNGGCGIRLTVGEPTFITVGRGQADPPHQWTVSRWSFFIMVANDQGGNVLPTLGQGNYAIDMWAHNGGEKSLDPAHPNLWGDEFTYDLGCITKENIENQIIVWNPNLGTTPAHKAPEWPLANIEWQYGRITPILTIAVEIKLTVQNDAPGDFAHELHYYGADKNKYEKMDLKEGSADTYRVEYEQDIKTDPPYEDSSQWRFMILPKPAQGGVPVQDQESWVASFEGSYTLCGTAIRDPDEEFT